MVDFDEDDWNFAQMEFSTFEVIKSKKWYTKIHEDYRAYAALQLTNKLNEDGVKPADWYRKENFQEN